MIKIALAGNPNCGKTTLYNAVTGSTEYVGNRPGVTVEEKEAKLKWNKDVIIMDLPGIYSLSPYTSEEVVAREYIIEKKPDVILNVVDGSNIERNLYLTTQLIETGLPVVIALNMMDIVNKKGDKIDVMKLEKSLGCSVVLVSALKGTGLKEVCRKAVASASEKNKNTDVKIFDNSVEQYIEQTEELLKNREFSISKRWFAIKLFENDEKILENLKLDKSEKSVLDEIVKSAEKKFDDDTESVVTNERYSFIEKIVSKTVKRNLKQKISLSDKIDKIVTNRVLALPIFALIMWFVYYISVTSLGTIGTDWANDGVFGDGWHLFGIGSTEYEEALADFETSLDMEEPDPAEYGVWVPGIPVLAESALDSIGASDWVKGLVLDGIIGGVGAVLGFVPQILILFFLLAILEDCGYMARIAFIMDRIFRKFGLSGKSFIPVLIGTGCGVPGVMASRTIENNNDRRLTIITTTFIPCSAKLPIIALIAGAMFPEQSWVAPSAYFIGIAAIVFSGIVLKRLPAFSGDPAPFVMELPAYHIPAAKGLFIHMWDRGKAFIKKAGTIIFVACAIIWLLQTFNWSFEMVDAGESMLADIGSIIAPLFAPLGFGHWQASVAAVTGLVAKENVVGTFGVLYGFEEVAEDGVEIWSMLQADFTVVSAYAFLVFNLLCAPCFAAIGAIRREMASFKWTAFAICYQTGLAYIAALLINLYGNAFLYNGSFVAPIIITIALIGLIAFIFTGCGRKTVPV